MLTYHTLLPHDSDVGSLSSDGFFSWQVAGVTVSCFLIANSSAVDMLEINYVEHISGIKYKARFWSLRCYLLSAN